MVQNRVKRLICKWCRILKTLKKLVHERETSHKLTQKESPELFYKKAVLKTFAMITGKHLYWSLFLIKLQKPRSAALLKMTPTQVISCEYYRRFKNTYFEEHLRRLFLLSRIYFH